MLKIHTLPLGDYMTNTYIVHQDNSRECVIIDAGYEARTILAKLEELKLEPKALLLTHGHFDHVGAVEELVRATGCDLWMSKNDWSHPRSPVTGYFYPIAGCDFCPVHFCEDGQQIHAAGLTFTVCATPGHTPGSLCYLCENAMFSGDTLFARSCGRTDLPGGDWQTLMLSLERLASLEGDYNVYPGHGSASTLDRERKLNPYMQ